MTKTVALGMLRTANNGTEILSILDTLTSDNIVEDTVNEPTADTIEF